jgi:spermidine synthase
MPAVKPASSSAKKLNNGRGGIKKPAQESEEETHLLRFDARMAWFALLLFFSGTAALIYQVLWVRQLSLVVGVEVYSITVAVSAFFAGLAAGGALLGRMADGWKRPLLLYALLEAGVALTGFLVTVALAHTAGPFVAIQSRAGVLAWALPFLLVGAPAFLMGGTLPVAVRSLAAGTSRVAKAGGWVYAANTAGGIAGALLSSFLLLPWLGVRGSALAAALFNLVAAGVALTLDRQSNAEPITRKDIEPSTTMPTKSRVALALYAIAGGIALGYEVVWSQAVAQFLSTRVFAFSVVLATYLTGLVVGSALYARFSDRVRDAWGLFGLLISAAGFVALLEIAGLSLWQLRIQAEAGNLALSITGSEFAHMCAQFLVAAVGLVFVPTVLLGAAFPVVLQLTVGPGRTGRDVPTTLSLL